MFNLRAALPLRSGVMAPDPDAGEISRGLWGGASCDPYPVMLMAVVKGSYAGQSGQSL